MLNLLQKKYEEFEATFLNWIDDNKNNDKTYDDRTTISEDSFDIMPPIEYMMKHKLIKRLENRKHYVTTLQKLKEVVEKSQIEDADKSKMLAKIVELATI